MESVQGEIKELKSNIKEIESAVHNTNEDIQDIHEKIKPEIKESVSTERKLRLEVWGRKWNLIIKGVEGDTKEQPRTTEKCVRAILQDVLHMDSEHLRSILFLAAHRLPGEKEGKKKTLLFA
jgi:seryl-tRNA synthetase